MTVVHVPIMVEPIIRALLEPFSLSSPSESCWFVDCTFGGGGHTSAMLRAFEADPRLRHHRVLAFDKDADAVERGRERFEKEISEGRLEIVHHSFSHIEDFLKERSVLALLADLGFSSDQLEDPTRGLSFRDEGPLDMRLDRSQIQTCQTFLGEVSESDLEKVLREWGEERFSKRIASAIVSRRQMGQLPKTTRELSELVVRAIPPSARHGRIHAATRTFQALRIAVNEELDELDYLLEHDIIHIKPGGRIAIISFHSLEDRKVKNRLKKAKDFCSLAKKPLQADLEEIARNPRARSAKLRIAERA